MRKLVPSCGDPITIKNLIQYVELMKFLSIEVCDSFLL